MAKVAPTERAEPRRGLPARYSEPWREELVQRVLAGLKPGMHILDVGGGCFPTIPPELRPPGCYYAGLDLSASELRKAPAGAYDEIRVADVVRRVDELEDRFDVVVSWQVLEHVKPLETAISNIHAYLRPGGRFVALFSGTFSAFGLINQIVPSRLGPWVLMRLLRRDPDSVFPAYYHHCWSSRIEELMAMWESVEVEPRFRGAEYWAFSRPLQRLYLVYENWAFDHRHRNLATHYLVDARR